MDFEFTPEQESLRRTVRRWLEEKAPLSFVRRMYSQAEGCSRDVWQAFAELGVTGILVPEEHGGAGMAMVDAGVVLEELGRALFPGPYLVSAVVATRLLELLAGPEDRRRLLPGLADGGTIATVALPLPGRAAQVRAQTSGGEWVLSGSCDWVPDPFLADLVLVAGRAGGETLVFVVEAADAELVPQLTVDGSRRFATLELEGTPARPLGTADASPGLGAAVDCLLTGRVTEGLGTASKALELAVDYAKQRVQFGKPVGAFQSIQHLCADMLQALELGRVGAYYALWAIDGADPAEAHRGATMAMAHASDAFEFVGANCIQVHGGVGFSWEHDSHLFYKRLLTLQQELGGRGLHLDELARLVVDRPG
ncbi:MAG: Acryloyl-CoA reductase (NADH) [Acidimicrobiales bacterium]|nr:Acryloyl-CoA reductase (NADH) [Acidimicrobiales bacterium]